MFILLYTSDYIAHYNYSAKTNTAFHLLNFILLLLILSCTNGSESPGRFVKTQTTPSSNQQWRGLYLFSETTETQHTEQEKQQIITFALFYLYIPGNHSHPIRSTGVDWHFDIDTTWGIKRVCFSNFFKFKEWIYLFKFRNIYFSTCIFIWKFLNMGFKELSKEEVSL